MLFLLITTDISNFFSNYKPHTGFINTILQPAAYITKLNKYNNKFNLYYQIDCLYV